MKALLIVLALLAVPVSAEVLPEDLIDLRYCGEPKRDEDGEIIRSSSVIRAFKKIYPCPATLLTEGACEGWAIQHNIPLVCGGCDSVTNMYWMPNVLKSGAGKYPIDRWEQKVYCDPPQQVIMPKRGKLLVLEP